VVAADGGNSKTDLVLASLDGAVLAQLQAGGTRPHLVGMTRTADELAALTARALELARLPADSPIDAGAFFLANVDLPDDELEARTELERLAVARKVEVSNDVFAVLRAGSERDWGIAVVSGAGINAAGIDPSGRVARFLSLGSVTGDWGGGYAVAISGLGAAVRAEDGRGPRTALTALIAGHFATPDASSAAVAVHRKQLTEADVLALAPVVFDAASDGDEVACGIVARLADEVAHMAATLLRRLDLLGSDVDVVLGGGTLQSGNGVLLDRIHTQLLAAAPNATLRVLGVPPVAGALVDALGMAGASPEAKRAARRAFTSAA
jgi:N-acetylglucosamine kinase-like BadF-type ATPase